MQAGTLSIIILVSVLGTFAWIGVHVVGLIMFLRRDKDAPAPGRLAVAAWITSFATGFLGPFAILGNMVAFVMGAIAWKGASQNPGDAIPAKTATVAGLVLSLTGCLVSVAALALSYVINGYGS